MLNGFGSTQRKILESLLQNKTGMTIDELVNVLNITRTAVNQHINALAKDGYLKKHTLTKTGGRPGQLYVLSDKGVHLFPKQYAWFSDLLLKNLKAELGDEGIEKILATLGEQIADNFADRLYSRTDSETVAEIVNIMQELGYQSSTNTEQNEIYACNCVFHELAVETPEVCTFDLSLLSAMSGRKVEHASCMVRGNTKCSFKFTEPLRPNESSDYQVLKHTGG